MNVHALAQESCAESEDLISLEQACTRSAACVRPIHEVQTVLVAAASGRILAEGVRARIDLPPFDQAAMDGYALSLVEGSALAQVCFPIQGRVTAGTVSGPIPPHAAVRIFTGAPIPAGSDAVIMEEHVKSDGACIAIERPVRSGDNIRRRGEDVRSGDRLLSSGQRLDARHVGLLAAQGIAHVRVRRRPRVAVVSTGDEFCLPGQNPGGAGVYDSNRPMLMALGEQVDLEMIDGGYVRDDPQKIADLLASLEKRCDLIVSSGGASVGEEDRSVNAVARAGGSYQILHIAMKPGKPAVIGRIGGAAYLGLPGNPFAAFVSWLILGGAMVSALEGRSCPRPRGVSMGSAARYDRRPGRTEFVPVRIVTGASGLAVEFLGRGGSARLSPLASADGLARVDAMHAPVMPGDPVIFHPFRSGLPV